MGQTYCIIIFLSADITNIANTGHVTSDITCTVTHKNLIEKHKKKFNIIFEKKKKKPCLCWSLNFRMNINVTFKMNGDGGK